MLDNIQTYFKDQYQFSLKKVSYDRLEIEPVNAALSISDQIDASINDRSLFVTFSRNIYFDPESAFTLSITFDAVLGIKDDMLESAQNVDWKKELIETDNPYMANILSRVSSIIANITSSYGQPPVPACCSRPAVVKGL